jgi:hypothetical protein
VTRSVTPSRLPSVPPHGAALDDVIETAKRESGRSKERLTVMSMGSDPFRLHRETHHANSQWLLEQMAQGVKTDTVHLRGLHYILMTRKPIRPLQQGEDVARQYSNTDYQWLIKIAAVARWLGYVPYDLIVDERNAAPVNHIPDEPDLEVSLFKGDSIVVLGVDAMLPRFNVGNFAGRQEYRLVLIGEKTSLAPVLLPIAKEHGAELLLPRGDISDTLLEGVARRATEDGRHTAVFYFSDFDPSGHAMPHIASRKLQAFAAFIYDELSIEVRPVALTYEQVIEHDLPEPAFEETEHRGEKWKQIWNREQTEIDALAALYPDVLEQITREAIAPFFDYSLADRVAEGEARWRAAVDALLQNDPRYQEAKQLLIPVVSEIEHTANECSLTTDLLHELLSDIEPIEPEPPDPEYVLDQPKPLFSTEDDWLDATLGLIERRQQGGGRAEQWGRPC